MALARVQATALAKGSGNVFTISFSTPPTPGNGIVIELATYATTVPPTAVDNQGNIFLLALRAPSISNSNVYAHLLYLPRLPTCTAPYSISVALGTVGYYAACAVEVSGVGTGGLAVEASTSLGSSASSTTPSTGTSAASTVAELFTVGTLSGYGGQASITVESVSPAWTQDFEQLGGVDGTNGVPSEGVSRVRTSQIGVTQSCSWTLTASTDWACVLAAFKATTAPASTLMRVQGTPRTNSEYGATITVTFATPPTIGNAIVVPVAAYDRVPASATDNWGNTYAVAATQAGTPAVGQVYCAKIAATGSPFTITVTLVSGTWAAASAIEVTGVGTALLVDKFVSATGSGTTPASGATAALTGSEVFAVGVQGMTAAQSSMTVATVSPPWLPEFKNHNGPVSNSGEADSRLLTSATGTTTSISWTNAASSNWAALVVGYKATAAAPPGPARVQATAKVFGLGSAIAIPFTTPPTLGNAILVAVTGAVNGISFPATATDNYGNTYVRADTIVQTSGTDSASAIYYCASIGATGASLTITVVVPAGTNYTGVAIEVSSGTAYGLTLDQTKTAIGSSTTPATGATAALTAADEFVVAVFSTVTAQASITTEVVSPTWTQEFEQLSGGCPGEADSRLLSSASGTTTSASWTLGTTGAWSAVLATFKALTTAPVARVTQDVVELLSLPILPAARVTQSLVEILSTTAATLAEGRVTQALVEILSASPPPTDTRVTQSVIELLSESPPPTPTRLTQLAVELFQQRTATARASQLAVELFLPRLVPIRTTQLAVEVFRSKPARAAATQLVVELFVRLPPCTAGEMPIDSDDFIASPPTGYAPPSGGGGGS